MGAPRIGIWDNGEFVVFELDAGESLDLVAAASAGTDLPDALPGAPPDVVVVGDPAAGDVETIASEVAERFPTTRIVVLDPLHDGIPAAPFAPADAILGRTLPPTRVAEEIAALIVSAMRAAGVALPSEPTSVGTARRLVRHATTAWGAEDVEDTAALLATELVANAVRHGGDDIDLVIRVSPECVRVEVRDSSEVPPARLDSSDDRESGRGVALVDALSEAWGSEPTRDGKSVWFELHRQDD